MLNYRLHSHLGSELKTLRKAAGKTQKVLATKTNLSLPTIIKAESGRGTLASFIQLAEFLNHKITGRSLPAGSTIGESLKILRERQKLSLRSLSVLTELSIPTIVNVESNSAVNLSSLERIGTVLGAGLCLVPIGQSLNFYNAAANSSAFQAWTTPPDILDKLYAVIGGIFDIDPCSPTLDRKTAPVKARVYYTGEQDHDGLLSKWHGKVFVNPPYGRELRSWIKKCHDEALSGRVELCIALIPARPDTIAWHHYIAGKADVLMLRGRLRFGGHNGEVAPFPSALIIWNASHTVREALKTSFPDAWFIVSAFIS